MMNDLVAGAFAFGLRLSAPVLIAIFLAEIALVFVNRTLQQLNILSVGFAVRVLVGVWIIAAGIGAAAHVFTDAFWSFADRIADAFA